jgi:CBS domain containing-hemolysin-like protein
MSKSPDLQIAAKHVIANRWLPGAALIALCALPAFAQASMFKGEALDTAADIMAWVVLIIAPVIGIAVFWLVHILPEKIAEQRQHPQAKAIQTLCLLSLVFGGLLWPLAWLWAYSKPVLYKLAYGTDRVAHGEEEVPQPQTSGAFDARPSGALYAQEFQQLRQRINELEARLSGAPSTTDTGRG